jgi:hypothetical protein
MFGGESGKMIVYLAAWQAKSKHIDAITAYSPAFTRRIGLRRGSGMDDNFRMTRQWL